MTALRRILHPLFGIPSTLYLGGGIYPEPTYHIGWLDGIAANFSPQGCDMVGLYIYQRVLTTLYPHPRRFVWQEAA